MLLNNQRSGFSLVESLVAIVIFFIGITGGLFYYFYSQTSIALELNRRNAAEICQARIEFLRTIPYNLLDEYNEEVQVNINEITGIRKTIIEDIDEDEDGTIDYKKITVRVEWNENNQEQKVELITFISQ